MKLKKPINSTSYNLFNENKATDSCKSNVIPNDFELDINAIQDGLIPYRLEHNRFVPEKVYHTMVQNTAFNNLELAALQTLYFSAVPGVINLNQEQLHAYGIIIASQLANPKKWASYPILDKLHLSVDITPKELEMLLERAQSIATKAGFNLTSKPPKRHNGQFHEAVLTFCSKEHKDAKIYFFLGDYAKSRRNPMNLLRIELNPARHSRMELKRFFSVLKQSKCLSDYKSKMESAKVTRRDLAVDLIFCQMPLLIADKSNVSDKYANHSTHKQKGSTLVQTIIIGDKDRSNTITYAKTEKLLEQRTKRKNLALPFMVNSDMNPISVARIEHRQKKQQDGGTLLLSELDKTSSQNMFKSLRVYRPELLKTVPEELQSKVIRDGYMVAMKKHNTAAFLFRDNFLKQFKMYINDEVFMKMQKKILKEVKQCIISPDKNR
ncbi:hypothetical protein [Shewanella xiamenensis]|uniref:Initiator Rep protein domain-containing protein n=1 Tax=Shewanella xiamenensis TaxID=332186 RepID=A0ABT6UG31_9GAMM|nr:hypothetical protein [Shewanella xiamenensis]MDI5833424.1 hypothetical protein [Shewanella xiamenensis]